MRRMNGGRSYSQLISGLVAAFLVFIVACGSEPPTVEAWVENQWQPLVDLVPTPGEATKGVCQEALGDLREGAENLEPVPTQRLREASHAWLTDAESLVFNCVARPDFDYAGAYEELSLIEDEVETLIRES